MNEINDVKTTITITDLVAFWGAITGTLSLAIAYFTYNRDGTKVKLSVRRGYRVYNSPIHDPDEEYTTVTVYNKGRRPITITKVYYQYLNEDGYSILSDSLIGSARELLEGKSTDYLLKESEIRNNFNDIDFFGAYDAIGNLYKAYVAPFYKRCFYKTLYFLHIKKRQHFERKKS